MKKKLSAYILASRKGSREAELENRTGWVAVNKIHKSKKAYDRKQLNHDVFGTNEK
jgi:hypothetical protein